MPCPFAGIMVRLAHAMPLVSIIYTTCDAFVFPQARCFSEISGASRGTRLLPIASRIQGRFITLRKAAEEDSTDSTTSSNGDETAAEVAVTAAQTKGMSAVPEDLDYYSGLVGRQPDVEGGLGKDEVDVKKKYPINLPSYLLLLLSTVACIAFIGSIFEVTGPNPELGYTPTYIIGTLAFPTFIFLFYSAIMKGQAEVEEDDAKYRGGRGW